MIIEREIWLRFLWSFSLCEHMGDASEAVRELANKANLPIPGDKAELDNEKENIEESWRYWIKSQGIEKGIY